MVAAGLSPREALESATLAPARLLGWDHVMGSVDSGKIADLVLLDGNPLQDISNTRRVAGVFAQGRYYSRQDLDGMLAAGRQIAQAIH
jgi:imidazolonepropionase-like amidohydrolase